jgi:hypothetical protein
MSGIGNISKAIRERLSEIHKISGSGSTFAVRSYTASSLLQRSLYVSRVALSDAKRETDQLRQSISELTFKIEELRVKSQGEILGLFDEPSLVGENSKDEVSKALDKAKKDLKVVLDGLKWWKLLWRVDEISEIISTAVDKAWCKELERQVRFSMLLLLYSVNRQRTADSPYRSFDRPPARIFVSDNNSPIHTPSFVLFLFPPPRQHNFAASSISCISTNTHILNHPTS